MKRIVLNIITGALLLGTATASFADEREGKISRRQERQQQRIGNAVKNGSLTAHETGKLENRESRLNKEIRTDRRANGGNLTNNEKEQINRQQNHLSNQIYKDKHNGQNQQK